MGDRPPKQTAPFQGMTEADFDAAVLAAIGSVTPKSCRKRKADCTVEEFAAKKAYHGSYVARNATRLRQYRKDRMAADPDAHRERKRAEYAKHKQAYRERNAVYRSENAEAIRERRKRKYSENVEKERSRGRARREANRDEYNRRRRERRAAMTEAEKTVEAEKQKAYRQANRERLKKHSRAYYEENREQLLAKMKCHAKRRPEVRKAWLQKQKTENRSEYLAKKRQAEKRRYGTKYGRLSILLRTRLNNSLRLFLADTSTASGVRDLGCSIKQLASHLEAQFADGMCWDNWGEVWQIDHIFPLAAADLSDRAELLAVCNWRNLQPLTVADNTRKQDTVTAAARRLFKKLVAEMRQVVEEETAA